MVIRKLDIAVSAVLVGIAFLVIWYSGARRVNYGKTECIYNLKIIHLDYANFMSEHGKFVSKISTNAGGTLEYANQLTNVACHFRALVPGTMPTWYLNCPLDKSVRPAKPIELTNTNISYFLSVNPPSDNGEWVLSGNRNILLTKSIGDDSSIRAASWNANAGLHGDKGYLLLLDGSVSQANNIQVNTCFTNAGNTRNKIAIP
jgi:hypothetical protein